MTQLVNLQTTVQTVFGVVDENGNVIPQEPIVVNVGGLENLLLPDIGAKAHAVITGARDQALANMEAAQEQQPETPKADPKSPPNRAQRRATKPRNKR